MSSHHLWKIRTFLCNIIYEGVLYYYVNSIIELCHLCVCVWGIIKNNIIHHVGKCYHRELTCTLTSVEKCKLSNCWLLYFEISFTVLISLLHWFVVSTSCLLLTAEPALVALTEWALTSPTRIAIVTCQRYFIAGEHLFCGFHLQQGICLHRTPTSDFSHAFRPLRALAATSAASHIPSHSVTYN